MKEGDYITCKKNYYKTEFNNFFQIPIFKRNQKYKISNISYVWYSNSCATFGAIIGGSWVNTVYINNIRFNESDLNEYFYTLKEERKIKLDKIKNKI